MKLSIPDEIVFIVLAFSNILFGLSFYFRNRTSDQFSTGGHRIPSWVAGIRRLKSRNLLS